MVADGHVADWSLPTPQGIAPVAHVIVGHVEPRSILGERLFQQFLLLGPDVAAVHEDPAPLLSYKEDAIVAPAHADELGPVGIFIGDLEVTRVIVAVRRLGRQITHGLDRDWSRLIHTQSPLGNVVMMGAPVGQLAARVLLPPTEFVVATL